MYYRCRWLAYPSRFWKCRRATSLDFSFLFFASRFHRFLYTIMNLLSWFTFRSCFFCTGILSHDQQTVLIVIRPILANRGLTHNRELVAFGRARIESPTPGVRVSSYPFSPFRFFLLIPMFWNSELCRSRRKIYIYYYGHISMAREGLRNIQKEPNHTSWQGRNMSWGRGINCVVFEGGGSALIPSRVISCRAHKREKQPKHWFLKGPKHYRFAKWMPSHYTTISLYGIVRTRAGRRVKYLCGLAAS